MSPRRLRYWQQKTELVGCRSRSRRTPRRSRGRSEDDAGYAFRDLVVLRAIVSLLDKGIPLQRIRRNLEMLRDRLPELDDPAAALRLWDEALRSPRRAPRWRLEEAGRAAAARVRRRSRSGPSARRRLAGGVRGRGSIRRGFRNRETRRRRGARLVRAGLRAGRRGVGLDRGRGGLREGARDRAGLRRRLLQPRRRPVQPGHSAPRRVAPSRPAWPERPTTSRRISISPTCSRKTATTGERWPTIGGRWQRIRSTRTCTSILRCSTRSSAGSDRPATIGAAICSSIPAAPGPRWPACDSSGSRSGPIGARKDGSAALRCRVRRPRRDRRSASSRSSSSPGRSGGA